MHESTKRGESKGPSAVLLVGTGALDGAWNPVYRSLRATISPDLPDDPDLANLQMARLVHLLRFAHGRNSPLERQLGQGLAEFRKTLAHRLREATGVEILVRPAFLASVAALCKEFPRLDVITTNWDLSIDQALANMSPALDVLHLHGSAEQPDLLYLPSELSVDPYHSKGETQAHAKSLRNAIDVISRSTDLILYGLSLSPLDAELCQALWLGREGRPKLRSLRVVDLQPEFVGRRASAILGPVGLPELGVTHLQP
jgi:hypothetical protein